MTDDAWNRAAQPTYRINSVVGEMARGLRSVAAAKERYLEAVRDSLETDEAIPNVEFLTTTNDPDDMDRPTDTHIACVVDGSVDACIWRERPHWPERLPDGERTELAMAVNGTLTSCIHRRLICLDVVSSVDGGRTRPEIQCATCGQVWTPFVSPMAKDADF